MFDWTSNILVSQVIAKGGPNANVYTYLGGSTGDTGLRADRPEREVCRTEPHLVLLRRTTAAYDDHDDHDDGSEDDHDDGSEDDHDGAERVVRRGATTVRGHR